MKQAMQTLKYWADVEALTAPDAEGARDKGADHFVTHVQGGILPWQVAPEEQPKRPHRHFVRFGILSKALYESELLAALKTAAAPDHDPQRGRAQKAFTFLGVFEVDSKGLVQPGSLQMAAFALAYASLRRNDLPAFPAYNKRLCDYFERQAGIVADMAFISELEKEVTAILGWTLPGRDEAPSAIVASKAEVNESGKKLDPRIDPLNGFFLEEIHAVNADIEKGRPAGLVLSYLAEPDEASRIDCSTLEAIDRSLSLDRLPDGRWPSKFALTMMQQVGVNEGLRSVSSGGIFSLNGPPGTGKTTLLMDVVAAVLVERAKVLASFASPRDAFTQRWKVQYPGKGNPANVYALDKRLHGFSMVVASANNGAVENITREFPNQEKIAPRYRKEVGYFPATATALLNLAGEDDDDAIGETDRIEAWGLISAVLGKMANRATFKNTLEEKDRQKKPGPANVYEQLGREATTRDWRRARQEFSDAITEVARLKKEVMRFEALSTELSHLRKAMEAARLEVEQKSGKAKSDETANADAQQALKLCEEEFAVADKGADLRRVSSLIHLLAFLPSSLSIARRAKAKLVAFEAAVDEREKCENARRQARSLARQCEEAWKASVNALAAVQQKQIASEQAFERSSAEAQAMRQALPGLKGFAEITVAAENDRQQMLPRTCDELEHARAMAFIKAIALHSAFVSGAGNAFSGNLKRAIGMLTGDAYLQPILDEAGGELWTTLSLLVPVVSTTFASFASCFAHMPRGGIGYLFVDEAGQAVPQHAVGALARARRALVVGDPLQVEPVITLDKKVDAKLRERHGARVRHAATATSMQVIADQNNRFGSYLVSHTGERVWVGSPLKVHRRCVEPMFSISNRIAYNETMVLGRGKLDQEEQLTSGDETSGLHARPLFGPSMWIDVQGTEGCDRHYIPAQAELALNIVKAYVANGWTNPKTAMPDLYIVSPFKSAASGMREQIKRSRRIWAGDIPAKAFDGWVKKSVGTVHTFQGKEAETVIFLLGAQRRVRSGGPHPRRT